MAESSASGEVNRWLRPGGGRCSENVLFVLPKRALGIILTNEVKTKETEQACFRVGQGTRTSFQTVRNNKQQTPHVKKRVSVCVVTVGE